MANTITLYSISELLERNFFIPSYQRGYRWDKQQVIDLLDDIYAFATKPNKSDKEFYCLQPIVVKAHSWKKKISEEIITGWEIVDGQQRLTTVRILFAYLIKEHLNGKLLKDSYDKDLFTLTYETREDSEDFMNDITEDDDEYIDHFYMSSAYKYIREWFENKEKQHGVRSAVLNTLVYKHGETDNPNKGVVQVIWYEIEDNPENKANAIDTFIRINLGKIPLTSSELIKALFLQEREFFKGKEKENEIAKLKQLQIATEWDKIESALQNDDFWWFINKNENNIPARIDFIFNLIKEVKINNNPEIKDKIGTDTYATFRYFYQKFDKQIDFDTLKKEWDDIKHYYFALEEWYNNPIWYHYIGFLIACGGGMLGIYNLTKYDFETKEEITTKKGITLSLKKKIKHHLRNIKWEFDSDNIPFMDISYANGDKQFLREVLLLYNIEYIVKQCEAETLIYKFPFKTFKEIRDVDGNKMSWDVEHIDSFNSNKLPNRNTRVIWLQFAIEEIEDRTTYAELIERINDYIQNEKSLQSFEELQQKVIEIINETENDEDLKNNIGNLTLLDAGTNRGYGNALFPTKRKKIIEKDKVGVFIPICTKNVFLKYFDASGQTNAKWSDIDIVSYRNDIAETLKEFLPIKPQIKSENE